MRRGAWVCCLHDVRRLMVTPRAWAVGLLILLFLDGQMQPVRYMMLHEGLKVGLLGMLTYLLNDPQVTLLSGLLLLMLLFDAPMTDETQKYIMIRTGRAAWARGHALYILVATAAFVVAFCGSTALLLWPYLDWSGGWGTGIVAFTEGMYEVYDSMLNYDPWLVRAYTPLVGGLLSVGLKFVGLLMLGMLMCAVNVLLSTRLGFLAPAALLMLDSVADEYFTEAMYYISPMSLTRLSFLDYGDGMGRPTVWYGAAVLIVLCGLFTLLTIQFCRRREIRL